MIRARKSRPRGPYSRNGASGITGAVQSRSPSYLEALQAVREGHGLPGLETVAQIGEELGLEAEQTGKVLEAVADGFRAEVRQAVVGEGIIEESEAEALEDFIRLQPELFDQAVGNHASGSLANWQTLARMFKSELAKHSEVNPEDFEGEHSNGARVYKSGGRWYVQGSQGAVVSWEAALAAGIVV